MRDININGTKLRPHYPEGQNGVWIEGRGRGGRNMKFFNRSARSNTMEWWNGYRAWLRGATCGAVSDENVCSLTFKFHSTAAPVRFGVFHT